MGTSVIEDILKSKNDTGGTNFKSKNSEKQRKNSF